MERIDFLKVDTEGAEMNVLRGIREEHWPLIRQAVIEAHHGRESAEQIVSLLEQHGFETIVEQPSPSVEHLLVVYALRPR